MSDILSAVLAGAPGRRAGRPPDARLLPGRPGPAERDRHVRGHGVRRQGPPPVPPRRGGAPARAGPRRGLRGGHGLVHQLQHGLDVHLRAAAHLRLPRPPGQGGAVGGPPRARLPRRRLRRLGRGPADGLGGAQLEGRRQGHRPLQLRRRPGPLGPRRLHAGGQPAHLGLRDQLRRPGRHHRGQGQPAHAQADAPQLGGGGRQRAVQLDRLPHAGLAQRRPHDAGRQGARVGGQRRPRAATPCQHVLNGGGTPIGVVSSPEKVEAAQRPRASRR